MRNAFAVSCIFLTALLLSSFAPRGMEAGHQFVPWTVPAGGATSVTLTNESSGSFQVVAVLKYNSSTGQYEPMGESLYAVDPNEAQSGPIEVDFANSQPAGAMFKFKIWRSAGSDIDVSLVVS